MGQDAASALDVIEVNYPNNIEECCSRMFRKWRETTPTGSWGKLLQALKGINLMQLVRELEELLSINSDLRPANISTTIKQGSKISQQQQQQEELGGMVQLYRFHV